MFSSIGTEFDQIVIAIVLSKHFASQRDLTNSKNYQNSIRRFTSPTTNYISESLKNFSENKNNQILINKSIKEANIKNNKYFKLGSSLPTSLSLFDPQNQLNFKEKSKLINQKNKYNSTFQLDDIKIEFNINKHKKKNNIITNKASILLNKNLPTINHNNYIKDQTNNKQSLINCKNNLINNKN